MTAVRWTARITGLFLVALVLLFAVSQGLNPMEFAGTELAMLVSLFTSLIGMCVLWKWEGVGGALVVVGMLAFYGLNFGAAGQFPGGWVLPLCFLPGILALVSWWHHERKPDVALETRPSEVE